MSINWDELEAKYSFKQVENGEYIATIAKIEVSETPTQSGSYAISFILKELNGASFPYSSSHWISFKPGKDDWRAHHMKSLLRDMGVDEAKARKKIDECESAGTNDQIAAAYRTMFAALAKTSPKAKVKVETQAYKFRDKITGVEELRENGHRTEFAGESYMPPQTLGQLKERYPDVPVAGANETKSVDDLGGEDVDISSIPF